MMTLFAALFFALLAGMRLAWVLQGDYLALVLAAHAGIAAYLLVARNSEKQSTSLTRRIIAWGSALLPLFMVTSNEKSLVLSTFSAIGVGFAVWALWRLGRSFGVAPADRGLVQSGPYRFVRHPMYLGELFSFVMVTAGNPSWWNFTVLVLTVATILMRIHYEEELITGYGSYAQTVQWRLIPYVW
jgi:protein-S-isoprenylcysteine O-methyltransferase Ste14